MDRRPSSKFVCIDRPAHWELWAAVRRLRFMMCMIIVIVGSVLSPRLVVATTWHVPGDVPTIQGGINAASPGDDVLVAPGTYFEHEIVMKAEVWVHSEQGPGVTIVDATGDGVGFDCAELQESAVLEGFTILNGHAYGADHRQSGGGVRCVNSRLVIRDCMVTECTADNLGGGIYAWESDIEIESCTVIDCSGDFAGGGIFAYTSTITISDCRVIDNGASYAGGIYAMGPEVAIVRSVVSGNMAGWGSGGGIWCTSPAFTIRDCLVTHNVTAVTGDGSGLYILGGPGSLSGCTVANNTGVPGDPAAVYVEADMEIDRAIIAFNDGSALRCVYSQVTFQCNDVYGNAEGNDICGTDLGGNFSADPLFCDAENGDYTLEASSPCLPGNHPDGVDCGLIGARGEGCGAIPVLEMTWGRIKAQYRR